MEKALDQELCDDYISRAALLKAIDTWDKFGFEHTGCFVRDPKDDFIKYVHYDDMINCIKGMPNVQQESKIDVINKIRAEIAEFEERIAELPNMAAAYVAVGHCLDIIDAWEILTSKD